MGAPHLAVLEMWVSGCEKILEVNPPTCGHDPAL